MAQRNDIHSPSNFDPAAYTYVGSFDNQPGPGAFVGDGNWHTFNTEFGPVNGLTPWHAEVMAAHNLLKTQGAQIHYVPEEGNYQCDHCGARIRYTTLYQHTGGQYIAVGDTCAYSRFGCDSRREYDIKCLREQAKNSRERAKAMGEAVQYLEANDADGMVEWMLTPSAKQVGGVFLDISRKLIKYGSLSPKQLDYARVLLNQYFERQRNGGKTDQELAWEAQKAAAEDCPTGRTQLTGTIVKLATHYSPYGDTLKMTVKDDRGFVVWVTVPDALFTQDRSPNKGDKVTLAANVQPSDTDPKFGFAKRPTKAQYVA